MVATGNRRPSQYHLNKRQKCVLRTLDNLPMKYGSSDSQTLASSYRDLRSAQMDEAKWATKVSGNQFSESRRLFENALKLQSAENSLQDRPRSRYSARSQPISVLTVPHTGPTLYGSPLYRQDGEFVFPSQRTPSEPPPRYFRAKSPIQEALERSNSAFRVTTNSLPPKHSAGQRSQCQTPGSSYPEFVLIPNEEITSEPEVVSIKMARENTKMKEIKACSVSSEPKNASEDSNPVITVEQVMIEDVEVKTADMMVGTDDIVGNVKPKGSYREPSFRSQKSNSETKETPEELIKETVSKKHQLQVTRSISKTSSSKSMNSIKSSKSSKGKKEQSDLGEVNQQPTTEDVNQQTEEAGIPKPLMDASEEDSITGSLTAIVRLPDYICPSSEEKSREARTKHWLHESTFTNADRYVPLV